jgi:Tol biopolymer transport system component
MKHFIVYINLVFSISILFSPCNPQDDFPVLKGPYLGQKPPGMTPELFAPGIISREDTREFAITFSPDGRECFFTRSLTDNFIITTKEVNGKWADPDIADFSGKNLDFEPHITPDGNRLIFGSNRPLPGSEKAIGFPQFYCEKADSGWSSPKPLGSPFKDRFVMYVSVTNDGTIYFTGNENGKDGIYMSKCRDGQYQAPVALGENINYLPSSAHPFISPDESYLIYDAESQEGNVDLFISFKKKDGTWTKSVSLGEKLNTDLNEMVAFVSRDGKYLFFSRLKPGKGDIYWVDAKIIERLKPKE